MRSQKFLLIFFLLISCSSAKPPNYSLDGKYYKNDLVSVQTAVNLATASYIKGCVAQKKTFHDCQEEAKSYVKDNIISIMDQGKSPK